MEAESTQPKVAATNGVAETNGVLEHEENDSEVAGNAGDIIDYLGEGDAAVNTEEEDEMGEPEYLEGEIPEEECVDEREIIDEIDELAAEATDKSNATDEQTVEAVVAEDVPVADVKDDVENDKVEGVEPDNAMGGESEDGEFITGDDAQLSTIDQHTESGAINSIRHSPQKKQEDVDENQCRVCTSKVDLISLFKKTVDATPADMLLVICPSVSIAPKDYMPQFICSICLNSVTIAIQLKNQLETTERDLRKRLSRGKNKVRRPRGYVVIDAPASDSGSEEEEPNDDVEFKVSDVAGSSTGDSDSADSDISEKRKRTSGRRRQRKKATKRAAGSISGSNDDDGSGTTKKKCLTSPTGQGPFECDQCDLTFSRKQSYVLHRKTHDTRNDIHCEICNKKFRVQRAYKAHLERHELNRPQFRCELCEEVFKLRTELKRHMAAMHDEHGLIYECKHCHRTFLTQSRLHRHQNTNCPRFSDAKNKRSTGDNLSQGRDLFKSVAPLTTTYWSDSFSD